MKLFERREIGKLSIKNRIVMAPMGNGLTELDGRISQRAIDYYVARAKGGVGLITTSAARTRYIEQQPFTPLVDQMVIDAKIYGARLNELAEAAHDYGARVCVQLTPGQGRVIRPAVLSSGSEAVGPSPSPTFSDPSIRTRALSTKEIKQLVDSFQKTAEIVRAAGIDAVQVNAHGGYLVDQFMTSLWNTRSDEYGGSLENRLRFLLEIIASIQRGAGSDFPVLVKYGLTHHLEGGREVEEGVEIARRLESAGVAALEIDSGCYETMYMLLTTSYQPHGCNVEMARKVKEAVRIPVIAVGRLDDPRLAEEVLEKGYADFISLGKGLLADPDWVNKVKAGRLEDIRPCVGCNDGCLSRVFGGMSITCTVNPCCGNEKELALQPADEKKKVMVVGGGPGGMEAALIASSRGHDVTLIEKSDVLGGNLVSAAVPEFKRDYRRLIEYLAGQLRKQKVKVTLNSTVTADFIGKMRPEVVILATGSKEVVPRIPGIDKQIVVKATQVLKGERQTGRSVAVIGGGAVGCELALYIAGQRKKVTIVEMLETVAKDMPINNRMNLLKLLGDARVDILTLTKAKEITDQGVVLEKDGMSMDLPVDTVAVAVGMCSDVELANACQDVPEVHAIGDCVQPRKVFNAIREAYRTARLV